MRWMDRWTWIFSVTLHLIVSSRPMPAPIAQKCGRQNSLKNNAVHSWMMMSSQVQNRSAIQIARGCADAPRCPCRLRLCTSCPPRQPEDIFWAHEVLPFSKPSCLSRPTGVKHVFILDFWFSSCCLVNFLFFLRLRWKPSLFKFSRSLWV